MLFLSFDIPIHRWNAIDAHGESSESALPSKLPELGKVLMEPIRGGLLQLANDRRQRDCGIESTYEMEMILYAADCDRCDSEFARGPRDVSVKAWTSCVI
jgi:hypothetical protein